MTVETEVEIAAPREEVFDLLLDPSRLDEWVTASRGVADAPDGGLRSGSSFRQRLRLGGARFDVRWKVTELERPCLAVWEGRGPAGSHAAVRYELAENGPGTRFRYTNTYDLPGGVIGAMAGRVTSAPARHAMRTSLRKLKRMLEDGRG
jgi:uncharacterized protein YndB with AHSA1/START domain